MKKCYFQNITKYIINATLFQDGSTKMFYKNVFDFCNGKQNRNKLNRFLSQITLNEFKEKNEEDVITDIICIKKDNKKLKNFPFAVIDLNLYPFIVSHNFNSYGMFHFTLNNFKFTETFKCSNLFTFDHSADFIRKIQIRTNDNVENVYLHIGGIYDLLIPKITSKYFELNENIPMALFNLYSMKIRTDVTFDVTFESIYLCNKNRKRFVEENKQKIRHFKICNDLFIFSKTFYLQILNDYFI